MKRKFVIDLFILFLITGQFSQAQINSSHAQWITSQEEAVNKQNTWIAFRKDLKIKKKPKEALVNIAADSKYWLWINGETAVFEGGLKRGPTPDDTYYDQVDIAPFLRKGVNRIAVLIWYFGKEGFSHKDSGKAGLIMSSASDGLELNSDCGWVCRIHPAFGDTDEPQTNYRLPESNIRYDARQGMDGWQTTDIKELEGFRPALEAGQWGDTPWNSLVMRPIPQWKDFGVREVPFERTMTDTCDYIIARLPYNMQMTPVITLDDPGGGNLISISTDHAGKGRAASVRAEYITRKGVQSHESPGWMNGQKIILTVPEGVVVKKIAYRETGYDTFFEGTFRCDNDFYNRFWEKALRTLYVNMRDTYFDCPDRERAQWWGDVVVLTGESFYTCSTSVHALMRKAILELAAWQKPDGTLSSPVPAGNYDKELPGQMLASVGKYGFWNYYMNTGDRETISRVYPAVRKYLSLWQLDDTGLTAFRPGGWTWGDWGDNRDIRLIFAGWHSLALEGAAGMARLLGFEDDAAQYEAAREKVKAGFNRCWDGQAYRHPEYDGETDDRAQALAVIAGIADKSKYDALMNIFRTQFHSSPYMEKYVMEALFRMGHGVQALERTEARFAEMVNDPDNTTLYERWEIGKGTVNHAWSGGAVTVIAGQLCGIRPLEPAYRVFEVRPDPASFRDFSITVPTVKGMVGMQFSVTSGYPELTVSVPSGSEAVITLPELYRDILINGEVPSDLQTGVDDKYIEKNTAQFRLSAGEYRITPR